ncbi:hypothetical protein D3C87_1098200 [compost metagenome]
MVFPELSTLMALWQESIQLIIINGKWMMGLKTIIHFLFKHIRHCEKAFSADEAIFIARITGMKDCLPAAGRLRRSSSQ